MSIRQRRSAILAIISMAATKLAASEGNRRFGTLLLGWNREW